MDKQSTRVLAICIAAVLLLLTYVGLLNQSTGLGGNERIGFFRVTYARCSEPPDSRPTDLCSNWRQTALAEALAVLIALAGALYVNERRKG